MTYYNADVRKFTEEQIEKLINDFTRAGWEFSGSFTHGKNDFHQFMQFVWNKESAPVPPDGYKIG